MTAVSCLQSVQRCARSAGSSCSWYEVYLLYWHKSTNTDGPAQQLISMRVVRSGNAEAIQVISTFHDHSKHSWPTGGTARYRSYSIGLSLSLLFLFLSLSLSLSLSQTHTHTQTHTIPEIHTGMSRVLWRR
jgi:hypothetical protein